MSEGNRRARPSGTGLALAEQRPDVGGHEAGEVERATVAREPGLAPDRVAVVEDLGTGVHEADHGLHVPGHGLTGLLREVGRLLGRVRGHVVEVDADREVGQRVVGRGLVGHDVDRRAVGEQARQQVGGVAEQADGQRAPGVTRRSGELEGVLQTLGAHIQVAMLDAPFYGTRVAVDADGDAAVHGDGERLGSAHAAQAGGQGDRP